MGPMQIQKIVLLTKERDPIQAGIPLEEAIPEEVKSEVLVHHLDAYVLAPLLEVELFRFAFGGADDEETNLLKSKLNGCFLGIAYSDIYDDVYEKKEALNVK